MSGVLHGIVASFKTAVASVTDNFFKYVTLLLNTNTTNGAQNNTFLDDSTNAFSITRNGNTTQGTFSPFSQTGWSNYFDGTGDYLTTASSGTTAGDFTYEAWIYQTVSATTIVLTNGSEAANRVYVYVTSAQQLGWGVYAVGDYTLGGSVPLNQWNHIAVVRFGSTVTGYVNGVAAGTTTTYSGTAGNANGFAVGANKTGTSPFTGYISNARFVNGTAVYTSNFTPPTSPLTNITNTSLLTCQSNRFIDNSSNAFAITRNGDVSVQAFSPFNPTTAWTAGTNGGSGYFDGTGDYLSAASDAAFALPAAFTFEVWLWPVVFNQTSLRGDTIFASIATSGFTVGRTDSGTGNRWGVAESNVAWRLTTTTLPTNAMWNHMVVVRDSSNNMALFLNGTRVANATVTTSFAQNAITIGSDNNQTGSYITGYMSGMRLVKGSAVYDPTLTTLTVPTAPLTAITNTSLLLNFTNAGIFDSASGNDLETVGNAQVSTAVAKWGTTSLAFDGTGDWLIDPDGPTQRLGTGDFTIEGWVYLNAAGVAYGIVSKGTSTTGWSVNVTSGNKLQFSYTATQLTGATSLAATTWYHFAVVRSGSASGNLKVYLNGTADATSAGAVTDNFNQTNVTYVGADRVAGSALNGYIDDLRITNGYARYTANFTAPTAAFPLNG